MEKAQLVQIREIYMKYEVKLNQEKSSTTKHILPLKEDVMELRLKRFPSYVEDSFLFP